MPAPNMSSRGVWAQSYCSNNMNSEQKAREQHANFLRQGWTLGVEAAHARALTLQVQDLYGQTYSAPCTGEITLQIGDLVSVADAGQGIIYDANGVAQATLTGAAAARFRFATNATGQLQLTVTHGGTAGTLVAFARIAENIPECDYNGMPSDTAGGIAMD